MAKKDKNERCPFQEECERKCEYKFSERKCDYYRSNSFGDNVIPDQEEIRKNEERQRWFEEEQDYMLASNDTELIYLPVDQLHPHPDNPRKNLGDLTELADSIRAKGVMQNLTVVHRAEGGYTVIIGHRRSAAAKLAGLTELPCIIVEMSHQEQVATMLLENMQRSDLNAYEQAQGFQLMMDFGETVESIAQKTGFSNTTVKRRLKIAELDQAVLKSVTSDEERAKQISLGDLDRLSRIEDIADRNDVLKDIGTSNFNQRVEFKLKKQEITRKIPAVKDAVKLLKAKSLKRNETRQNIYTEISGAIDIRKWNEEDPLFKAPNAEQLYYFLDEDWGTIKFYKDTPKTAPVRRPQAEIDREKYIEDVRQQLDALSELAYNLRKSFVEKLTVTKQNEHIMYRGAIGLLAIKMFTWFNDSARDAVFKAAGVEYNHGNTDESIRQFMQVFEDQSDKIAPVLIYYSHGDRANLHCYTEYRREFPKYAKNWQIDRLYEWLTALGYEMSDDEKGLVSGTHPLYTDKDRRDAV